MPELNALRAELAEIDREIMELAGRRGRIAELVGSEKAKTGAPVVVPQVERIVEQRYVRAGAAAGVSEAAALRIARALINESVDIQGRIPRAQTPMRICIAGGNGGMGRWLSKFFASRGHSVCIADPHPDGAAFPAVSLADGCADADAVVVSVPVPAADAVLAEVFSLVPPKTLVFDILSVKAPVRARLEAA
ncbi:MAG: chorismate mutase, partial [Methanocorpusculum sp.]|nr:chorismate mutase [Methanocorpusculum sp.]